MSVEVYDKAVDRGLEGVVACTTSVSSIVDATLTYRGYTIEDLAENATFEEVIWLLWNNEKPTDENTKSITKSLNEKASLSDEEIKFLSGLPVKEVHPMAWLRSAVSSLSLWDPKAQSDEDSDRKEVAISLMAKMPSLVAFFHRKREGKDFVQPKEGKSMAWNFLWMMKGNEPLKEEVDVMDTCLTLHADHELNCSAFAAKVTASSLSDIYSAITSGIGSLKGPLHGGANEQVMRMLLDIGSVEGAKVWVKKALEDKVKIMGFGHRVYKNGDPRAKILKGMSKELSEKTGNQKWFEMSKIIEDTVVSEKGLLPNVDFYSATVYYSMGIPMDLYTPIFAVSRTSGWLAHIFEQYSNNRIYRPRGEWVGKTNLKW
jgi:citrate synthase